MRGMNVNHTNPTTKVLYEISIFPKVLATLTSQKTNISLNRCCLMPIVYYFMKMFKFVIGLFFSLGILTPHDVDGREKNAENCNE